MVMEKSDRIEYALEALVAFATLENVKLKKLPDSIAKQCKRPHMSAPSCVCTRQKGHDGPHIAMRIRWPELANTLLAVWDPELD